MGALIDGSGDGARRGRITMAIAVAVLVVTACGTPVGGQASRSPVRELNAGEVSSTVADITAAHADLTSVVKTVVNRDPYSVDRFGTVETVRDGRVHRLITIRPTSSALNRIEEIRCLGDENFTTPIPADLDDAATGAHSWVRTVAEPDEDAADSAHLVAYFCDWGYPTALDWDVEFLLVASRITDLGERQINGEPLRHLLVEVGVTEAYQVPGLGWVSQPDVPDDGVDVVEVQLWLDGSNRIHRLTSDLEVNGRTLGTDIIFAGFDGQQQIAAPDPQDVLPG